VSPPAIAPKLTITYDRIDDILSIDRCQPYINQDAEEVDDYIVARLNPKTGAVETPHDRSC
jgi:hypothetical protein